MTLQEELAAAQAEISTIDAEMFEMAHGPIPPEVAQWSVNNNTPVPAWSQKLKALQDRRAYLLDEITDCQSGISQGVV